MKNLIVLFIVLFGLLTRFIPHPPNFTPILSMVLFGSVYFNNTKLSLIVPLSVMIISDYFLGLGWINFWVYASLAMISIFGLLFKKVNITSSIASSLIFFIITNFGVWLMGYPKTIEGFLVCYTLAIPFFVNTLLSTVLYSYVFKIIYKSVTYRLSEKLS